MKTIPTKTSVNVLERNLLLPVFLCMIFMLNSGSSLIPEQETRSNKELLDMRLSLLEKLEKGSPVANEDIKASFNDISTDVHFECPVIISQDDIEKINSSISRGIEEIKIEIGCLRNSEEFVNAMDELKRGRDELKRELEKMREELRKIEKSSGIHGNV